MLMFAAITLAIIFAIALLERRWAASTLPTEWLHNFAAFGFYSLAQFVLLPMVNLKYQVPSLFDLADWSFLAGALAFFLLMDFGEFAFHRAQHAVPFLWRMHSLHHSDPNMNVTTTVRHFWGDPLLKAVTIWPMCWLVLKPTPAVLAAYMVASFYHYFVHANLRVDFGRFSWLLNGPAYHRRHHSSEPAHFNCNFASLFPIFDVIFGSYRRPDGFPETGLPAKPARMSDIAFWPMRSGSAPEPS